MVAHILQGIRGFRQKFVVRLIEGHDNALRDPVNETVQFTFTDHRTGRIIRIRDVNNSGPIVDCVRHRGQVMGQIRIRHFHGSRAEKLRQNLVNNERMFGRNDIVARLQKGVPEELNDLVRTVPEHDVVNTQTKFLSNSDAQMISAAVRIEMRFQQSLLHRLDGHRRGSKRILVRRKFYDLTRFQPKFPRHILDRFPRDVTYEVVQPLVRFFKDLVHARNGRTSAFRRQ